MQTETPFNMPSVFMDNCELIWSNASHSSVFYGEYTILFDTSPYKLLFVMVNDSYSWKMYTLINDPSIEYEYTLAAKNTIGMHYRTATITKDGIALGAIQSYGTNYDSGGTCIPHCVYGIR